MRQPVAEWRWWRAVAALLLSMSLAACAVSWIAPHDKDAADRIDDISRRVLTMYQDLLLVQEPRRAAAVAGAFKVRHAEIETRMRMHLLQEEARNANRQSARIARLMLETWQSKGAALARADPTARSDATLAAHRRDMHDLLKSAIVAEEAKKLAGGGA